MSSIDTVKQIYEAFGRGDIPAIIDKLDSNVEWDVEISTPGVPWMQPRRGAANIPAFFESLAPLSFQRFEPHTFFANDNKVFVLVAFDVKHVASGKQYTFPYEGHLWVFNDAGKVVKYQHVTDTALHQRGQGRVVDFVCILVCVEIGAELFHARSLRLSRWGKQSKHVTAAYRKCDTFLEQGWD